MAKIFGNIAVVFFLAIGAACALDWSELPDPGANLKVGQWATYSIMGATQKQTIVKIEGEGDERMITVAFESIMGDKTDVIESVISVNELKNNPDDLPDDDATTISKETRVIGDKEIGVIVLNINGEGSGSQMVLSHQVPISGIVSMEAAGMGKMMELMDFGE